MSRVCHVQGLSCSGFVVSRVCRVQGLACPGLAVSRVCLRTKRGLVNNSYTNHSNIPNAISILYKSSGASHFMRKF
jgi:hypothetical protein